MNISPGEDAPMVISNEFVEAIVKTDEMIALDGLQMQFELQPIVVDLLSKVSPTEINLNDLSSVSGLRFSKQSEAGENTYWASLSIRDSSEGELQAELQVTFPHCKTYTFTESGEVFLKDSNKPNTTRVRKLSKFFLAQKLADVEPVS